MKKIFLLSLSFVMLTPCIGNESNSEIEKLRVVAEQGNSDAQFKLGRRYYKGEGVPRDYKIAAQWFTESAQQHHALALCFLGQFYESSLGVEFNLNKRDMYWDLAAKQIDLIKTIAEQGDADAMYFLAILSEKRVGVNISDEQIFQWIQKAALNGSFFAQDCLIEIYAREKQEDKRTELIKKSSDMGNEKAMMCLATSYMGESYCWKEVNVEENPRKGVELLQKMISQGNTDAPLVLALCYLEGIGVQKEPQKCVEILQDAAKRGNYEALNVLAQLYLQGKGVKKNPEEAVKYLKALKTRGNLEAMVMLGECYQQGSGVEQDIPQAIALYRSAAERGNSSGQCKLGDCYYDGTGVEQSYTAAIKWYQKAAKQGNSDAQYKLGKCYCDGTGVEQNNNKGWALLLQAAKHGNEKAKQELDKQGIDYTEQ